MSSEHAPVIAALRLASSSPSLPAAGLELQWPPARAEPGRRQRAVSVLQAAGIGSGWFLCLCLEMKVESILWRCVSRRHAA